MADFPRQPQGLSEESSSLRPGADGHVALSAAELEALANSMRLGALKGTLLDFFEPLRNSDLKLDRPHGPSRRWLDFSDPEWDDI